MKYSYCVAKSLLLMAMTSLAATATAQTAGGTWHDGKPFTSADVQCTWDMILEKRPSNWRKNGREEVV